MMKDVSKRTTLQAVMDEDLRELLHSLHQLEAIENGQLFCEVCGTLVTLKNLQLIIPLQSGEFRFVCDRPDCVSASNQED